MSDISVPSDKIEDIKEEMKKEFDNIIDEVCLQIQPNKITYMKIKHCFDGGGCWLWCRPRKNWRLKGLKGSLTAPKRHRSWRPRSTSYWINWRIKMSRSQSFRLEKVKDPAVHTGPAAIWFQISQASRRRATSITWHCISSVWLSCCVILHPTSAHTFMTTQ